MGHASDNLNFFPLSRKKACETGVIYARMQNVEIVDVNAAGQHVLSDYFVCEVCSVFFTNLDSL
ncbi:hypothetical protein TRAPUB_10796 [Trametes pubescens]|uniref:Uncharacterized protein n=1 Tax=Trametes pubescens TaxID=154538 RepID=A0A1M2VYJ9_TRAPU|nr:hypothetical protein TRAPUB_10796 [Trametes pubescens]